MKTTSKKVSSSQRRDLLKASALLGGLAMLSASASASAMQSDATNERQKSVSLLDVPLSSGAKVTVERRDSIVLIGINRPGIQNRIDPGHILGLRKLFTSTTTIVRFVPPFCSVMASMFRAG